MFYNLQRHHLHLTHIQNDRKHTPIQRPIAKNIGAENNRHNFCSASFYLTKLNAGFSCPRPHREQLIQVRRLEVPILRRLPLLRVVAERLLPRRRRRRGSRRYAVLRSRATFFRRKHHRITATTTINLHLNRELG